MTQWVIAWSPLAIFAAIAQLLSAKGFAGVHSLVELLGVAYLGMAILAVILTLVIRVAGQSPLAVLRKVKEPLILGFTTRSSEITYPLHLKKLVEFGVPHGVASTILPLAYIFNRDGAVLYGPRGRLSGRRLSSHYAAGDHDFDFDDHHHRRRSQRALRSDRRHHHRADVDRVAGRCGAAAVGRRRLFDMGRTALNVYGSTAAAAVAVRLSGSEDGIAADTVTRQASV